jgi:hypothetical protein
MILCFVYVKAEAGSYFTGYVYADEPGIAVGGISIDIYGSTLRSSANGLKRYEHYYCRTVKTDSSGAFTFARPSTKTLLKVDLGSLPSGTGVNAQTRLVSSRYDDTFRLSYINRIGIGKSGDGSVYKVELTAADGTSLIGSDLAFDHGRIIETGVLRLQGKIDYTDIGFRFLNDTEAFSLSELQTVFEAVLDRPLDISNFRRFILGRYEKNGRMVQTEQAEKKGRGRPAVLYRLKD